MAKKKINSEAKKEVGRRFLQFRKRIGKAQHQLAAELNVSQSTIANIECGKAFPNITYLHHFYHKYRLNVNWLLTNQGDMLSEPKSANEEYLDLINLLQVPLIEKLIMAKLVETKALLKDQINNFFEKQGKEEAGGIS
jgi:transcriptional regulator with XRE-family HTH domain